MLVFAVGALVAPLARPLRAATTEQVLVDPVSGLAIFGYDPVSYYIDGGARAGQGDHELVWSGATWRFRSSGNLIAFQDHPEVYAPAFGGYASEHITEGRAVPSDPMVHAIVQDRLYLFGTAEGRESFLRGGERMAAEAAWPKLQATLMP